MKQIKQNNLTKTAEYISNIFNPGILAILILLAAVYKSDMPDYVSLGWYFAVIVLNGLIPGLVYLFFTSRGYVFDDTLGTVLKMNDFLA